MFDWLKNRGEIRNLRRELRLADDLNVTLNEQIAKLKKQLAAMENVRDEMANQRDKALKDAEKWKKEVREQTAADLLVNALRGLGMLPATNPAPDPFSEAARLRNMQQAASRHVAGSLNQLDRSLDDLSNYLGGIKLP